MADKPVNPYNRLKAEFEAYKKDAEQRISQLGDAKGDLSARVDALIQLVQYANTLVNAADKLIHNIQGSWIGRLGVAKDLLIRVDAVLHTYIDLRDRFFGGHGLNKALAPIAREANAQK